MGFAKGEFRGVCDNCQSTTDTIAKTATGQECYLCRVPALKTAPALPPTVYVHVRGGAVSIGKPKGIEVEVIDFDVEGFDAEQLCDGHNCEVHHDHAHRVYEAARRAVL